MGTKFNWNHIYEYYINKGFGMFLLNNISSCIIGILIALAPVIIFGCIDLSKITSSNKLSDIIYPLSEGFRRSNILVVLCTVIFLLFCLIKVIQFLICIPKFYRIHKYFATIGISDHELSVLEWNDVFDTIIANDSDDNHTILSVAQEILRYDNYICALIMSPSILTWKLPRMNKLQQFPMSRFFFYILKLVLSGAVLDSNGCSLVNGVQSVRRAKITNTLTFRFRFVGFILFILSPFVLLFELLYLFFHYAQAFKDSPDSLSFRRWTPQAKWRIREYNELPHLFNKRLSKSYEFANIYLNLFPSGFVQPLLRILSFLTGAFLAILFVIGLLTDAGHLLQLNVFGDKSLTWVLSIAASIYGICKVSITPNSHPYTPNEALTEVEKYIHFDFRDKNNLANSWTTYKTFSSMFQPVLKQAIFELLSVILNPILFFFVMPLKAPSIVEFIHKNSYEHQTLGWICLFSSFETDNKDSFFIPPEQEEKLNRSRINFGNFSQNNDLLINFQDTDSIINAGTFAPRVSSPMINQDTTEPLIEDEEEPFQII